MAAKLVSSVEIALGTTGEEEEGVRQQRLDFLGNIIPHMFCKKILREIHFLAAYLKHAQTNSNVFHPGLSIIFHILPTFS